MVVAHVSAPDAESRSPLHGEGYTGQALDIFDDIRLAGRAYQMRYLRGVDPVEGSSGNGPLGHDVRSGQRVAPALRLLCPRR